MSEGLPEGWALAPLRDLVEPGALIQYGILQPGPNVPNGVPYVRPTEVVGDRIDLARVRRTSAAIAASYARSSLRPGDVVLSIVGTIGKVAIVPTELDGANITQSSARLRPHAGLLDGCMLAQLLRSPAARKLYNEAELGTGVPRLNIGDIREMVLPLPPLPEQRRIVTQVEALLEQVNRAKGRLDRVPLILKRFRQAVLAAACSGELTRGWRETSAHQFSAAALIDGKPVSDADLPSVPEGWVWAWMDQVAEIRGGIQKQPKRAPKKNAYPYLRVANVLRGRLNLDQIEQMELFGSEPETYRLKSGDILIVEGNGSLSEIGRSAVWHDEVPNCVHQNHIIRVRPRQCSSKFLDFYWNSPLGTVQVSAVAVTTTGLYSLSTKKIAGLPVPVAPLDEQVEIVRQVEKLFVLADSIEVRVKAATARADKLPQAILSKAFSGELVPTEAELARAQGRGYETAEELLERVRTSFATDQGESAPRRKRGSQRAAARV